MYKDKLSYDEWRREALRLVKIVNRQYREISKNEISVRVYDDIKDSPITLIFPIRDLRLSFELFISSAMQGVCYVLDNNKLEWRYL